MDMGKWKRRNLLRKLMNREVYGEIRECRSQTCQRLFDQLPHRLAFPLSQLAPASSLISGHIFLGFTKCGQFVLSYTHTCDTDDNTLQMVHRYRLHWWLFCPYAKLRKVAEVMLFGDQDLQESIYENIYISVCQWPKDLTKLLIYGCSVDDSEVESTSVPQTRRVYITVTAVPSLDNCSACYQVATSYEEDDLAERWNSCVRFSCLQHGVTIHTSFELVPPFPVFVPEVQMKMEGHVILNAGNFIHCLSVNLENVQKRKNSYSCEYFNMGTLQNRQNEGNEEDSNVKRKASDSEFNCETGNENPKVCLRDVNRIDKDREWEILIGRPPVYEASTNRSGRKLNDTESFAIPFSDCDIKSVDSDCSSIYGDMSRSVAKSYDFSDPYDEVLDSDDSALCSRSTEDFSGRVDKVNICKRSLFHAFGDASYEVLDEDEDFNKSSSKLALKEYEFIDEITEDGHEKLSAFRRRRLADKKYEFSDENSENIPQNYRSFRSESRRILLSPSRSPRMRSLSVPFSELSVELGETSGLFRSVYEKLLSPSSGSTSPSDVLRPINQNITSPILSPRDGWKEDLEKPDKVGFQRWNSRESVILYSPMSYSQQRFHDQNGCSGFGKAHQALKCVVDIKRRYIEVDDELVSVITDIEDDELSTATGYHNALPLEVHGSGYSQMQMISKNKAEKLMVPGILVRQVSLDVEQFCHETAQKLCNEAGKKYYFCNDYNVEIVDVCPASGNIIALASVLVQAGSKLKSSTGKPYWGPVGPHMSVRRLYKATATFLFNVDTKEYYILDKEPLVEEDPYSLENGMESLLDGRYEGEWWMRDRVAAQSLRSRWVVPTDYFSRVKVMTNQALLNGKSLAHIMEGYHHVALVFRSSE